MGIFSKKKRSTNALYLTNDAFAELIESGEYTSLAQNPEVFAACSRIAEIISSMTIYLMSNTKAGDIRIKNELSRKVDIAPNKWMTRKTWMNAIVMNLLLYGNGNSVVIPHTDRGLLGDLIPVEAGRVSFVQDGEGYKIIIDGQQHNPEDLIHFVYNPDRHHLWKGAGIKVAVKDVIGNLKQASNTEKNFMASKWKPSVIVKVDGMIDEFSTKEGRRKLLDDYIETSEAGEPWVIPGEQFQIEQIRPLSLADLALKDNVELDKKTVASIIGVPAFLLGVGVYNKADWDNFVNTTIRHIAMIIEQELTRKIILSEKMYWKFNVNSLYSYDMDAMAKTYDNLYTHGLVTGNEVRDKLSMSPKEGLDELIILENYIPADRLGDQKKLNQEDE